MHVLCTFGARVLHVRCTFGARAVHKNGVDGDTVGMGPALLV